MNYWFNERFPIAKCVSLSLSYLTSRNATIWSHHRIFQLSLEFCTTLAILILLWAATLLRWHTLLQCNYINHCCLLAPMSYANSSYYVCLVRNILEDVVKSLNWSTVYFAIMLFLCFSIINVSFSEAMFKIFFGKKSIFKGKRKQKLWKYL